MLVLDPKKNVIAGLDPAIFGCFFADASYTADRQHRFVTNKKMPGPLTQHRSTLGRYWVDILSKDR